MNQKRRTSPEKRTGRQCETAQQTNESARQGLVLVEVLRLGAAYYS